VRGYRGATCWCDDVTARTQSDLEYVRNWKLSRDIIIIIRTMRVLIHPKAY
jgi:lipopolysaccharide/colanic/teichoic acid biosynthesis glycosyltransferase